MTMTLSILPFDQKHAGVFDHLNRAWIEQYFTMEPFDNEVLTKPKELIIDKGGEVWFAELDGQIVGSCALMVLEPGLFEFTKLGVDEKARGKGVARALLRHCIGRAKQCGHEKLRIFTSTRLAPANALYRSEGFIEIPMSDAQKQRYKRADIMYDLPLK